MSAKQKNNENIELDENNQYFNTVPDEELKEFEQNLENENFENMPEDNKTEELNENLDEPIIEEKRKPKKKVTKKINDSKKKKTTKKKIEKKDIPIEQEIKEEKEIDSDYLDSLIARKATEKVDVPIIHHID